MADSASNGNARSLANIQTGNGGPNGQPAGEPSRAITHGAYSELKLAPIREARYAELVSAYPHMIATAKLQAQRLAQIEAVCAWLDEAGIMHTGPSRGKGSKHGDAHKVAHLMNSWMRDAERWFDRAEEIGRHLGDESRSMVDQMQGVDR